VGLVLGALLTTFTVVSAARARESVAKAIDFANQAVTAAEQGDQELAAILIAASGDELGGIVDDFNQPWLALGRFVPILGQHSRALRTMADAGSEVAASAAEVIELLDAQRLLPAGGRIDLAETERVGPAMNKLLDDLSCSMTSTDRWRELKLSIAHGSQDPPPTASICWPASWRLAEARLPTPRHWRSWHPPCSEHRVNAAT